MLNNGTITYSLSKQVLKTPARTALEYNGLRLSYEELDDKSNRLANYLLKQGIGKGMIVPVCVNRSMEMIVSILGVIKSGAAYVPLDPGYPKDRLSYIIDQVNSQITITNAANRSKISGNVLLIDQMTSELEKESAVLQDTEISPSDLLYVIYTSGSSGKPKGVMVEHGSLASYVPAQCSFFGITENERILQFSNYCFDASIEQIFLALLSGACLVLISEEILIDMDAFSNVLKEKAITHLHATPGFLENLPSSDYPDLKRIVSAGEICKKELFRKWIGKTHFYNKYGPTEVTISILEYKCPAEGTLELKTLPIGRPIAGVDVYLLDENLMEVPPGVPAQIYAGGIQVARGYLNEPVLTSTVFIEDPFKAGQRLYRTGDLGRMLPDGNIEFLGRLDDQVKIRGYRIELGEVENTLSEVPGIKQCVITTTGEGTANKKLVAYVVADGKPNPEKLKKYLLSKLPEYMVPQLFVCLDRLPLTPNGKIDRRSLPDPDPSEMLTSVFTSAKFETEQVLSEVWKDLLGLNRVGTSDNFFELGGNSLLAQKLVTILKAQEIKLPVTKLYQFPTIAALAAFLDGRNTDDILRPRRSKRKSDTAEHGLSDVAIIGMACRFPGANTVHEFWENITKGKESIHFFADEELDEAIPDAIKDNPDYVKARGIIDEPAAFDPAFFGINPKLAELMDPQQRIFLEISWEALEHSGHVPQHFDGTVGVYCGCRFNTYYTHNVLSNTALISDVGSFQVGTVNDKDYIASRTAYALNLKGPAVNVQSACSTSLLAVAQAAEGIRNGYCDVALAGASSMVVPVNSGHLYEEGAMLSHDGHSRAFDANARGTVFSDGAGVVVLKLRKQAELDGDTIYAVIKGVGLSNDGGGKSSFTAPSASGQAAAVSMAIDDAGILPENISYIETHGTATPLGDPIEIDGLNMVFGAAGQKQYCAIGSVKNNIGHLTSASGVAGLIKTALALHYRQLPPSINYENPNPHIDFENSPFFVNTSLVSWETTHKRIAGVSSFGVGGTNVHVILEEVPAEICESGQGRPVELFCWSAKAQKSLDIYGGKLSSYLKKANKKLADVAFTLHTTREDFGHRRFVVAADTEELLEKLNQPSVYGTGAKKITEPQTELVFMFPGQGAQFLYMGKDLYDGEPVFRKAMDECAVLLSGEMGENILDVIYPKVADEAAEKKLNDTQYSQPALFSIGYALGKLWMSWDIFPAAFIGHSIGEFVAAYFSGVFSLADALKLIASRGRMMADLPRGSMLSVRTDETGVQPFLSAEISLAALNSPKLSVLAGTDKDIADVIQRMDKQEIPNRLLPTSHAFHSYMMDPVVEPFKVLSSLITLNEPVIPIVSTVTGKWLKKEEAMDPAYWSTHLRSTVLFGNAMELLLDEGYKLFAELGPGNSMTTLARQQAGGRPLVIVNSLDKKAEDSGSYRSMLNALGQLWLNGVEPNWELFYLNQKRSRLNDLPVYAFDNQNYWVYPIRNDHTVTKNTFPSWSEPTAVSVPEINPPIMRKQLLIGQIKEILENASGIDMTEVSPDMTFIEAGLDSLVLTQIALSLKKKFAVPVTFRQLNENYGNLDLLAGYLDEHLPEEAAQNTVQEHKPIQALPVQAYAGNGARFQHQTPAGGGNTALDLIGQQLHLLAQQLSLMQTGAQQVSVQSPGVAQNHAANPVQKQAASGVTSDSQLSAEEAIEIKKPFGAGAKIERQSAALTASQQEYIADLVKRYNGKTQASKAYTQEHRRYMADPRVVSGFRPSTKELVYSIVINRSKGSRLWDIDGNEYIDALNGFGSNMLGYQPDFIKEALIDQIEKGYEIGPQHELSGEVSKLICEFTNFDRAALCNTGSEAVLGAMRIARTVTGRHLIVAFSGSYHGIVDEVIVRGSKKLKTFPAAPGIMPEAVQNMLILDYGTEEALRVIEERSDEIAAVLVEPVQSRRCDFQPLDFLKKLRALTTEKSSVLIFDEVISGFRFHPGGVQSMFGIKADIGTYGKVAGGGISIGIIAGKKEFMDSLDGGFWKYGDDSIPEVGVTYFAGTFVRHPLALATAKASLSYLKEKGPQLQENLNANGKYIANALNRICRKLRVPIFIAQFGSLWRIRFLEDYPYNELFFTLMRYKGIHILEGFSCFLTTAHSSEDILQIIKCFEESLIELKEVKLIPEHEHSDIESAGFEDLDVPPVPNARLGKDREGNPAWFVEDVSNPGKYLQVTF